MQRYDARRIPLDLVFVDAQLEHLRDRSVHERLRRDILAPARALGCRSIWLAGISLGGFIALDYAAGHPEDWDGLCLLAPYLGNRMLIAEIAGSPGLSARQPGPLADVDEERRIWRFIASQRARREAHVLGVRARGPLRTRARPDGRGAATRMRCMWCPAAMIGPPGSHCGSIFWIRRFHEPAPVRTAALGSVAAVARIGRAACGRRLRRAAAPAGVAVGARDRGHEPSAARRGRTVTEKPPVGPQLDPPSGA